MGEQKVCDIEYVQIDNEKGKEVDGVRATCPDCGAETESFGQESKSVRRCMVLMRDECECDGGMDAFFTCDELE